MTTQHYCSLFEVIKDEGFAKILQCECGRKYRKFFNEDLSQMHILNEYFIKSLETKKWNKLHTV